MTYEYEAKSEKEAIELAAAELGLERDQFDVEILETQKNSLFKKGYVKIRVHTVDTVEHHSDSEFDGSMPKENKIIADPMPKDEFEKALLDFVTTLINKMGYEVKVEVMFREEHKIGVRLVSEHSSILIGRPYYRHGPGEIHRSIAECVLPAVLFQTFTQGEEIYENIDKIP